MSSSGCSGSAHRGRIRESRGSRSKRSPSSRRWRQTTGSEGLSASVGNSSSWIFGEVKRTIQKSMEPVRLKRPGGQNWATFLRNHAAEMWACDFLQIPDLFFRSLFASFIIDLQSRKADPHACGPISHRFLGGATTARSDSVWGKPRYVIRDNDSKFGSSFARG